MNSILTRRGWLIALLCGGIVFPVFLQLGGRGLNEPDEGRYGEIGREMLVSGDWLVPRMNGVPHYAKPPWIYWCIAASLKVFGVNEWAARLPSAVAAVITAFTVFVMGRQMAGNLAGNLAGLLASFVLVSSLLFFVVARLITPDMMLTCCITVALFYFWQWQNSEPHSWRWLLGFYLALAIGFLDKGLVPLGVCFLTVFGFLWFQKRTCEIPRLCLGQGLLLLLLIALPWFLILCRLNPDLYDFYLLGEVRDRILSGRGRVQAWFYHLLWLPGDCWPWTILSACAVVAHFRWWRKKGSTSSCFLLAWFILPLLLFSLSSSKLPTYILPIMPPISLMTGLWLAHLLKEKNQTLPEWAHIVTCCLLAAPLGGSIWYVQFRPLHHLDFAEQARLVLGLVAASILFGIVIWRLLRFFPRHRILPASLGLWWLISLITLHTIVFHMEEFDTELGHNSSWRELTRALEGMDLVGIPIQRGIHPNGRKPEFTRTGPRVVMYEFYFRSSSFYLMKNQNEVVPLYGGDSLWELKNDRESEAKLTRDDLITLLKGSETVFAFTRPQYLDELRGLTKMDLPLIKTAASGNHQVVLFCNIQG